MLPFVEPVWSQDVVRRPVVPDRSAEYELAALALSLGARRVEGWSGEEERLAGGLSGLSSRSSTAAARSAIRAGGDPLGERFCTLRSAATRRSLGATYTPLEIVDAMLRWARDNGNPARIVDPGTGSARFLVRAARAFAGSELVGVEVDPLAALIARANLAAAGLERRSRVVLTDYRSLALPPAAGSTLYVGNPPYVRHHQIEAVWKQWLVREAAAHGHRASCLAGLHAYFFLATAMSAADGDYGCFITAAEWLDVNYGRLVRDLFLGRLGGECITILEPDVAAFPDAATTAAIVGFRIGSTPRRVRLRRVASLGSLERLDKGKPVAPGLLASQARWSELTRARRGMPEGHIELGELFRVHRGQVTGANRIWIAGPHSRELPEAVLFPSVTKARELISAGLELADASALRRVIDLPADLSALASAERAAVERFLKLAALAGADRGYIARNRKAWWSVGLKSPAPILATYMARRPPAFVRNLAQAHHINIAHGLYPREPLGEAVLSGLVRYLAAHTSTAQGRTYSGGLTKFEPREMERIPIPPPDLITSTPP